MALLQLMAEEQIAEDRVNDYFDRLYKLVCVSERPASDVGRGGVVRSTYIVDWEQLVHLLEDYTVFGEDIVEVSPIRGDEARLLRGTLGSSVELAQA